MNGLFALRVANICAMLAVDLLHLANKAIFAGFKLSRSLE